MRLEELRVLDPPAAGLFAEGAVCLIAEPLHIHFFCVHGEAVSLQLGQVEDVADESLQPRTLLRDDVE